MLQKYIQVVRNDPKAFRQLKDSNVPDGATVLELDYSEPEHIGQVLSSHGIDTVISVLNLDFEPISNAQINLIRGSALSGTVKRFIPSDFNVDYSVSRE